MIARRIELDRTLAIEDADVDGFTLEDADGRRFWLAYEQLDAIARVLAPIRAANEGHNDHV